jgi:RNA polymerase sigma-70 factor (ECF subfamily)
MKKVQEKSKKSNQDRELIAVLNDVKSTSRQKESAFNSLYSKYQKQLELFFLKKFLDENVAEDLKMVVFEKIHKNISKYDSKYAFSTWMYTIATNLFIDHKRKVVIDQISIDGITSKKTSDGGSVTFQVKSDGLNPEQDLVRGEEVIMVQDAIESIDNEFVKELVKLRFLSGLSFDQIAKEMSIPNNSTLRVSVLRGKALLKEIMINPYL